MIQNTSKFLFTVLVILFFSCTSNNNISLNKKEVVQKALLYRSLALGQTNKTVLSNSLKIVTWNIQDLGRSKSAEEIIEIAKILKDFDLVAIQEVVAKDPAGAQAVAKIADNLNRMGSKWNYSISNPTKSPSVYMSERYAFLWKTSKVSLLASAYLDKDLEDKCVREPFIGKFQLKNAIKPFYIVNFHSKKFSDLPEEEIQFFKDYPKKLNNSNVFILGDFNLSEEHVVWSKLYEIGFKSAIENTKTTLKRGCKNGTFLSHAIDNIYYNSSMVHKTNSGSIDFVKSCENLIKARMLSDHLPVFLECFFD